MRRLMLVLALGATVAAVGWVRSERAADAAELQRQVGAALRRGGGSKPPLAGVSARARPEVAALVPRRIGADTATHAYHRYMNRCMACHAPPDPQLHSTAEWAAVVQRMDANMRAAGTLGLRGEDEAAVRQFLEKHGR